MKLEENILFKDFTTFRVGGPARFFTRVGSTNELIEALTFAKEKGLPFFILGGGSNILVSDEGFPGLVIKMEIGGIDFRAYEKNEVMVTVGAGEDWDNFVSECVSKNLTGIENLSAIPGTVGASPVQNIGAYGAEVKDTILKVEAIDSETLKVKVFTREECQFAYRDSIFKKPEGKKYIITSVYFLLKEWDGNSTSLNTNYKDVANYLKENFMKNPTPGDIRDAVISIRSAKLPNIREYGTAGSFFKNPIILRTKYEELLSKYPTLPSYPTLNDDYVKIPLAWILDNVCGFKGVREGHVGVYKNQALVLVNFGGASASEVANLAYTMIARVKEATGITIEPEVEFVGAI